MSEYALEAEGLGKAYRMYGGPLPRILEGLSFGRYQGHHEFWALRELSWQKPTLEQLFARIALGMADEEEPAPEAAQEAVSPTLGEPKLESSLPIAAPAPPTQASKKIVYNLNPFDQGASRDLGAPKAIEEDEGS